MANFVRGKSVVFICDNVVLYWYLCQYTVHSSLQERADVDDDEVTVTCFLDEQAVSHEAHLFHVSIFRDYFKHYTASQAFSRV